MEPAHLSCYLKTFEQLSALNRKDTWSTSSDLNSAISQLCIPALDKLRCQRESRLSQPMQQKSAARRLLYTCGVKRKNNPRTQRKNFQFRASADEKVPRRSVSAARKTHGKRLPRPCPREIEESAEKGFRGLARGRLANPRKLYYYYFFFNYSAISQRRCSICLDCNF